MKFIQRTGDWSRVNRALRRSRYLQILTNAPDRMLGQAALILQRQIKKGIRDNSLGLQPLAPSTLLEKARLGYSPNPLLRTGELVRSVVVVKKPQFIFIGVPRGVRQYPYGRGDDVANIAQIHHQGEGRMPKRPFILNAYKQVAPQITEKVKLAARKVLIGF